MTALRAQDWRHVIVSNHVPELADIVAGLGIRAFFADVITSGLVGYEKPHARMFEAAVRCAIPGAPVWMIGDNPECDCHPVGAFGANAILIVPCTDLWRTELFALVGDSVTPHRVRFPCDRSRHS